MLPNEPAADVLKREIREYRTDKLHLPTVLERAEFRGTESIRMIAADFSFARTHAPKAENSPKDSLPRLFCRRAHFKQMARRKRRHVDLSARRTRQVPRVAYRGCRLVVFAFEFEGGPNLHLGVILGLNEPFFR